MTKQEYREFVIASVSQHPTMNEFLQHSGIGLATETGEFLQVLRKAYWQGQGLDTSRAVDELTDVYFYLTMAMVALGMDEEELIEQNTKKLIARRANQAVPGTSSQSGGMGGSRELSGNNAIMASVGDSAQFPDFESNNSWEHARRLLSKLIS